MTTSAIARTTLVTVALVALTAAWSWPHAQGLSSTLLGAASDSPLAVRGMWALDAQGGSPFTSDRDRYFAAPVGLPVPRAVNVGNFAFTASVWYAGKVIGWTAALNLYNIVAFVLAGTLAYVLFERMRFGFAASAFAAYVFTFNPNHVDKLTEHPPLVATGTMPLVLLGLVVTTRARRRLPAFLTGLALGGSFYVNSYIGLFALAIAAAFIAVDVGVRDETRRRLRVAGSYYFVAVGFVLAMIPLTLGWAADPEGVTDLATARVKVLPGSGASAALYLLPGSRHPVLGGWMSNWLHSNLSWESTMFFGYTTMLLALAGIAVAVTRARQRVLGREERLVVVFAVVLGTVGVLASLKPKVDVLGAELPTLSYVLRETTTVFRVYSRFGVLLGFALVILAAYALSRAPRRGLLAALPVVALATAAFELYVSRPEPVAAKDVGTPIGIPAIADYADGPPALVDLDRRPRYLESLRRLPPGIVADYPSPAFPPLAWAWRDIFFQYFHHHALWQPLWNTSSRTDALTMLQLYAGDLAARATPAMLKSAGVSYVVLHRDRYLVDNKRPPRPACGLERIASFPAEHVEIYRVRDVAASGRPLEAGRGRGFYPISFSGVWPEARGWQWMRRDAALFAWAPADMTAEFRTVAVSLRRQRFLAVRDLRGKLVDRVRILPNETYFALQLSLDEGFNVFSLHADDPEAVAPEDPRRVTIAMGEIVSVASSPHPAAAPAAACRERS